MKEVTSLGFGIAFSLMWKRKQKKTGEPLMPLKTAVPRRNVFLSFSAEIDILDHLSLKIIGKIHKSPNFCI